MNINLDDKKIVKIVYRIDDSRVLEFNYKNGDLASVSTLFSPKTKEEESKPDVLSDSEMIAAIKNSKFMDELENARVKFKLAQEIADSIKNKYDDAVPTNPDIKFSSEGLEIAKKIIKMDEEGILDNIVKKHRGEIDDRISYDNGYRDKDGKELDITTCDKSIKKLKDDIISQLTKLEKGGENNYEFWSKVNSYKDYISKKEQLQNDLWNESVQKIENVNGRK